ncbi:MAG: alpha-galactosidase [Phycisphaerales bacterium]|nr:alpha-galactosidase [Phycisphaerales bacterium]
MLKIAMIGAGSIGFTRILLRDVLAVPELADTTFAFTDISQANLDMVAQLCRRDIEHAKLPAKVEATMDRRAAIKDADYIISVIRQGGIDAFQLDIDIPLQYGIDQSVGDTLCAGGIMYAQRTIPVLLDFCKDIRELAKPNALLLNYSNPMAMNTWACNTYGGVRTIGLCHGVQGGHWQVTRAIEAYLKKTGRLAKDYVSPNHTAKDLWPEDFDFSFGLHKREVDLLAAGINHQTWFLKVQWRGEDFTARLPEIMAAVPHYRQIEKVRLDVLNRFGYYSTESNGHFSEYVPWYRKRALDIPNWIDLSNWIHGETGGYLRHCTQNRNWFETDFPTWMKENPKPIGPAHRSEEHGSYIIESLETGRTYRGHLNVANQNHITNLPNNCTVEIPAYVNRNGINVPVVGDLPLACAATCSASVNVQHMAMEAAVHGNVTLLKQAMLHDPLTAAVCTTEEIWQLADHMLVAQQRWLPNYAAAEFKAAAARLAAHEKAGTRVKLQETKGAARLPMKERA